MEQRVVKKCRQGRREPKLPYGIAALFSQIVDGSISREHLGGGRAVVVCV